MEFYEHSGFLPQPPHVGNGMAAVLTIYLVVVMVLAVYGISSYIIKGLGLYQLAKRKGIDYPWMAFVPFARTYLQGEISGEISLKKRKIHNPGIWMIALPMIQGAVFFVFYLISLIFVGWIAYSATMYVQSSYYSPFVVGGVGIGTLLFGIFLVILFFACVTIAGAATKVLMILVNHQILTDFTTNTMAIVHAVLMGFLPLYEPICLLVMSRRPCVGEKAPLAEEVSEETGAEESEEVEGESVNVETEGESVNEPEVVEAVEEPANESIPEFPQRGLLHPGDEE